MERPDDPDARQALAQALLEAGHEDLAVAELREVVRLAPNDAWRAGHAHLLLGAALTDLDRPD